jgi:hypothetical protein
VIPSPETPLLRTSSQLLLFRWFFVTKQDIR